MKCPKIAKKHVVEFQTASESKDLIVNSRAEDVLVL